MGKGKAGFTLIELLIVVVIIGLLAGIALPKLLSTRDKAIVATLKSDLRNLATSQEAYWNDQTVYYGGSVPGAGFSFYPSPAVVISITQATTSGWAATATSPTSPTTCALFFGSVPPPSPAVTDGLIACQ